MFIEVVTNTGQKVYLNTQHIIRVGKDPDTGFTAAWMIEKDSPYLIKGPLEQLVTRLSQSYTNHSYLEGDAEELNRLES